MTTVWTIFSAFRPDAGLIPAVVAALEAAPGRTVVVDDGGADPDNPVWAELAALGVRTLRSDVNEGIAAALNHGIRLALSEGADAVVTFDQDSTMHAGFVGELVAAWDRASASGHVVGLVVPEFFAGVSQVHRREGDILFARHAIQSGMLIPRDTLEAVGLLRQDLFIDLVDTEFELRCSVGGRPSIAAPGLALGHELGRQYERTLFGRRVRMPGIPEAVTLSTPFRYYYRVRNRRVINREYGRRRFSWVVRDSLLEGIHFAIAWTIARPRRDLARLYRAGWRAGRRGGRMGAMPGPVADLSRSIRWSARELETAQATRDSR